MTQDTQLYESTRIWDHGLQTGQKNLIRAISDFFPKDVRSALDVGCGDGKITHAIAEASGVPFIGLDLSVEALSRCRFCRFVGDAACLPFEDGRFDLVMTNDTLEHMPEDLEVQAWRELFRVANKWVVISVPFREELLDATARCQSCGIKYHVNWHMRSYDFHQLLTRVPRGWEPSAIVLSGEPWSPMHPIETRFRREILGQWAGWAESRCPKCGASGYSSKEPSAIPTVAAAALGRLIYASLKKQRILRSHSEILVLLGREEESAFQAHDLPMVRSSERRADEIDLIQEVSEMDLAPYPQKACAVRGADGHILVQLPLYESTNALRIHWNQPKPAPISLTVEDALGHVFSGTVESEGGNAKTVKLRRDVIAGYYGVLVRLPAGASVVGLSLPLSGVPEGTYLEPLASRAASYYRLSLGSSPVYIQVTKPQWFDAKSLDPQISYASAHGWQDLFSEIDYVAEIGRKALQHKADTLAVQVQNLLAERDALLTRAREADALAVQVQNLLAERDALLIRAREADALAVQVQNLLAERDALLIRAREADALAVEAQNLFAEREELHENLKAKNEEIIDMLSLPEVRFAQRLRKLVDSLQISKGAREKHRKDHTDE